MTIKIYKPYTPTQRFHTGLDFTFLSSIKPEKQLLCLNHRKQGHNNQGKITSRHKGGGHKRRYRIIDFRRQKLNIIGKVLSIEYDPNRNAVISLILYRDGEKRYILHPELLQIGDLIYSNCITEIKCGNHLALKYIPLGVDIHNLELFPLKGGQLVHAAGTAARILSKDEKCVIVQLPSTEIRLFHGACCATIGRISNIDQKQCVLGKAGRTRWLGIRPTVRGSAMNPIDHPHGGGEGRCSIGHTHPLTPWNKPTLGYKTRKKQKSDQFIIKRIS